MANHELQTNPPSKGIVFKLRYDTVTNWMNSDLILKQGEAAIAAFPNSNAFQPPKAVGIKIGDGRHYFDELPWIQALAADVYSWAKYTDKPTYQATEIVGLVDYIAAHSGGGGGSAGSGSYQIVWDENSSKYILQQWNEQAQDWDNTTSEINLSDILNRINTIERWANGATTGLGNIYDPIGAIVYDEVIKYINKLDVNDSAVAHQFVTSVVEVDGKIQVSRSIIRASDITEGVLSTTNGGTGLSRLEEDEIMVGSNNGTITTRTFVTTIDPSDRTSFVTAGAIIDYVAQMTAGLTGAMHFVGEATVYVAINSRTDPQIAGYNFRDVQLGDVILNNDDSQELVWTGDYWRLLGDEGSYAIKGSITNVDIAENAAIDQDKIAGLSDTFDTKVDKEQGKGLSEANYTDDEKTKLRDIEEYAQENVIEHIFLNDEELLPKTIENHNKSIDIQIKLNGEQIVPDANNALNIQLLEYTAEEKAKLSGIEAGAQVNTISSIILDGQEQRPNNEGIVNITSNPHTDHINTIEHIFVNGTEIVPTTINDEPKSVNIAINGATQIVTGARYPIGNNEYEEVAITDKKLELAHIAATGDVQHLLQTQDTYIILNCGSSTTVI